MNRHEKAYTKFSLENPQVWQAFVFYATQAVAKNRPTSAKAIVERVRWDSRMRWRRAAGDAYKWNNNWTAYLGRDLMARVPGLQLETRKVAA